MVTLLIGNKGSGKTKRLIERANHAVENSEGSVVVLEKKLKMTYDISHKARLVDTDAYQIKTADALYGFISGICAGNYDVTDLLVDSTLKITHSGADGIEDLVVRLDQLSENNKANFVLSVSASPEELPETLRKYVAS